MDSISSFLGIIKKAGKLEIGEEPVGAACRARKSALVITASDAAENSVRRATHFAEAGQVPILTVSLDKAQLGQSLGKSPCAMISINDIGFAAALLKKITEVSPVDPEILASIELKANKALQRQKEKRAHERNLLRGKKKPWSPNPKDKKHT